MLITTQGVVIRERFVGENDKYIDVLTKDYGIIEVSVKGAKKINSKNSSATQLFAYSNFCFSIRKNKYFLNSTELKKSFYNLRLDIEKLSLASYFADLLKFSVVSGEPAESVLRLFLNTLHFLCEDNRDNLLLKSIFELRLMTEIGLMPDLVACKKCSEFNCDSAYFFINEGNFLCDKCYISSQTDDFIKINNIVLHAMRYIVFSEYDKLFNFKINSDTQKILSKVTEKYVINQLNRNFKTLDFYKSL